MEVPLTRTLQALSDPTRRKIVEMLKERDLNAGEVAEAFSISAPSISHHLSVLKNAELIMAERKGQFIVYSLNATVVQEVLTELVRLFHNGDQDHAL
jgi:ArsR family transcriptional regulator, arsenate/arsenite/antimonite-responsive transcriptional repressor